MPDIVFVDEFSTNLWTHVLRGRSKKGTPVNTKVPSQRGVSVSCVAAVSYTYGAFFAETCGALTVNADRFNDCFEHLVLRWNELASQDTNPRRPRRAFFILDNCSVHKDDDLTSILLRNSPSQDCLHNIRFLPPWSPFLNPVEDVIGLAKHIIRDVKASRALEFDAIDNGPNGTKGMQRVALLSQVMTSAWSKISLVNVSRFYLHCYNFFPRCIMELDIEGEGKETRFR